jgi:Zn-finger nucleic acid-binding protein
MTMECPRDGSPLHTRKREGDVEVDECGMCRGLWLDKGELEALQQASADRHLHLDDPAGDSVGRSINEVAQLTAKDAKCPRCGTKMTPRDYGFGSQIVIDACPADCGVWLDVGEIERLQAFYEQSNTDAEGVLPVGFWLRERLYKLFGSRR